MMDKWVKRNKIYKWPYWESKRWSISVNPQRWAIGFWWTGYMFGITFGPFEVIYYPKEKRNI